MYNGGWELYSNVSCCACVWASIKGDDVCCRLRFGLFDLLDSTFSLSTAFSPRVFLVVLNLVRDKACCCFWCSCDNDCSLERKGVSFCSLWDNDFGLRDSVFGCGGGGGGGGSGGGGGGRVTAP